MPDTAHYFFRVIAASHVLLAGLYFLSFARHHIERLVGVTTMAFFAYLILPICLDQQLQVISALLAICATAIPGLLWLLAYRFFNGEAGAAPSLGYILFATYMVLTIPKFINLGYGIPVIDLEAVWPNRLFNLLPQFIKLGLVVAAVIRSVKGKSIDLIESRRRVWFPIALAASLLAATVIVAELFTQGSAVAWLELAGSLLFLAVVFSAMFMLFQIKPNILFGPDAVLIDQAPTITFPEPDIQAEPADPALEKLYALMSTKRLYAEHGLTIAAVAHELGLQEYRLRRLINQTLGYRNFNQFLNNFRLTEAAGRLRSKPREPVLTIALDVGFRSLSSFNTAFKETYGVTPSAYRQVDQSDR